MERNEANTYDFPVGSVDSGNVVLGGTNNNWGGSMERALEVASIARKCSGKKNIVTSQKRSRKLTAAGNTSDHYEGNKNAYAVDISAKGKKGDELLNCIMSDFENGQYSNYQGGKWLNIKIDGYRYQFGWRVKDHYDHIHVGVKKIGGSTTDDQEVESTSSYQFNEKSKENLNKLFDELKKRNISDPESAIKDWIGKEEDQKDLKFKSFQDILKSDQFKALSKMLSKEEVSKIDEEIVRIKKIMK